MPAHLRAQVVVCPPFGFLGPLAARYGKRIAFGAQDCFWEAEGAYTGEMSPAQLRRLGAKYVIVGHSERRQHLGESDEMVKSKLAAALREGLRPIVCVGGGPAALSRGANVKRIVERQLRLALAGPAGLKSRLSRIIVAFEPPWALSNVSGGKPAPVGYAFEVMKFIRDRLIRRLGRQGALIPLLYGGSVSSRTVSDFLLQPGIGGFLVGGASLDPQEFSEIISVL